MVLRRRNTVGRVPATELRRVIADRLLNSLLLLGQRPEFVSVRSGSGCPAPLRMTPLDLLLIRAGQIAVETGEHAMQL